MRVLVCGGRDYHDKQKIFSTLTKIHTNSPITCIIHGHASGADTLGMLWAIGQKIPTIGILAQWKIYGKSAGGIRNRQLLEQGPDLVVAFPGGSGTADMVKISRRAGVSIRMVER